MSAKSILPEKKELQKLVERLNEVGEFDFIVAQKGNRYALVSEYTGVLMTPYDKADFQIRVITKMIEYFERKNRSENDERQ